MAPPLVGIFVGGKGRRMGGVAKGLLTAPGGGETPTPTRATGCRASPTIRPGLGPSAGSRRC
jgi:hypothetical protein